MQSVNELCEKGNSLSEAGEYQEALACFQCALEKIPDTYDDEGERVWVLTAIGDTLFQLQQYFPLLPTMDSSSLLMSCYHHMKLNNSHCLKNLLLNKLYYIHL